MAAIDLIVLGMLKDKAMGAYDIQKLVEYRRISRWVKISTPSIYKKVIQLEERGMLKSHVEKDGKMPEKSVYSLTEAGEEEYRRLMREIARKPVHMFLDFNAVIVNLEGLPPEEQRLCLSDIRQNIRQLKAYIEENLREKEELKEIPETGKQVLRQQYALAQSLEAWIEELTRLS